MGVSLRKVTLGDLGNLSIRWWRALVVEYLSLSLSLYGSYLRGTMKGRAPLLGALKVM
jgi:hypothetical protein